MKPQFSLPVAVFLVVSTPLVLLLNVMEVGGDFRLWAALGAGALATAFAQSRMKQQEEEQQAERNL